MTPVLAAILIALPAPAEPPITDHDRQHWSFRPLTRPPVPAGSADPIDAFIRAKLGNVSAAPPADKRVLARRVFLDLTGLPPTPDELAAFLSDTSPDAYEKLVDRLLASPHYGERWAQHWLDVVRFAETNGYELDADRPHAWRYRDYVIRSLNADKPYSRFLKEQIAGDELAQSADPAARADLLVATGMHRCGPVHVVGGNLDPAVLRQERLTEMVNGLGAAVLGLTVGCARCHDHKFDPLSAADYYRMQAYFASAEYQDHPLAAKADHEAFDAAKKTAGEQTAPLRKQVAAIEAPYRAKLAAAKRAALDPAARTALDTPADKRTPEQKKLVKGVQALLNISWDEVVEALSPEDRAKREKLREQIRHVEEKLPPSPGMAWGLDRKGDEPTHVLRRGDTGKRGALVRPGVPRVFGGVQPQTRTELADWLTRPDQPLTARVVVNRLWHHYFGRGIVSTVNDFGRMGTPPSHPELLDWLACELVDHGWRLKPAHRRIVLSAAYCRAATPDPSDPENKLFGRMSRKRLDGEAIRDAILTTAGTLTRRQYGPSVRVPLEPEVYDLIFTEAEPDGLWPVTSDATEHTRRSVYLLNKRNVRLPMLEAFDQPDTLTPCNGRNASTHAPQALILMNGPFAREQSRALAAKLPTDDPVGGLFRTAFGRSATAEERTMAERFLTEQAADVRARLLARRPVVVPDVADPSRRAALADLCLAVFNTNEFVHVP